MTTDLNLKISGEVTASTIEDILLNLSDEERKDVAKSIIVEYISKQLTEPGYMQPRGFSDLFGTLSSLCKKSVDETVQGSELIKEVVKISVEEMQKEIPAMVQDAYMQRIGFAVQTSMYSPEQQYTSERNQKIQDRILQRLHEANIHV